MEQISKAQLEQRVKELLSDELSVSFDRIDLFSDFANDLGADSLDVLEIVVRMEEELVISISNVERRKMRIVNDLYKICFQKLDKQGRIQS